MTIDAQKLLKHIIYESKSQNNPTVEIDINKINDIPNIRFEKNMLLEELKLQGIISGYRENILGKTFVYLTTDRLKYFVDMGRNKEISNIVFNISGGQVNIANDNGTVKTSTSEKTRDLEEVVKEEHGTNKANNSLTSAKGSKVTLTEIHSLLQPFLDSYMESVITNSRLEFVNTIKVKKIISNEKEKTVCQLYDLMDQYGDNSIITSEGFYFFVKYEAQALIKDILNIDLLSENILLKENYIIRLVTLYDNKFRNFNLYDKNLGAMFIKKFFYICFKFERNLHMSLMHEDIYQVVNYVPNENLLFKISANIEHILDPFQKMIDSMNLNSKTPYLLAENNDIACIENETIKNMSDFFIKPLIFEDNENAKSLKDVFVWPEYRTNLLKDEQDDLQKIIEIFLRRDLKIYLFEKGVSKLKLEKKYSILVILGMGGMGKSSLLEKLAYDIFYGFMKFDVNNIFFAKFSNIEHDSDNLFDNVIKSLHINRKNLINSYLILDAFDEYLQIDIDKQSLIEQFFYEINLLNCQLIITSRENYINFTDIENCFVIKLLTFNIRKRKEWIGKYNKNLDARVLEDICNYKDETDQLGEEFIGIPIIIYMIAANNILISSYEKKFDFYNALFGEKGVWYKRFYDINHPALYKKKKQMLNLILDIAKQIYGRNKLSISINEIDKVLNVSIEKKDIIFIKNWFGIVTYFRHNCLNEIEFAHKSIFEYYIAYAIYIQIKKIIKEKNKALKIKLVESFFYRQLITQDLFYYYDGFIERNIDEFDIHSLKVTLKYVIDKELLFQEYSNFKSLNQMCNLFCNIFNCLIKMIREKSKSNLINIMDEVILENLSFFLKIKSYNYMSLKRLDLSNKDMKRMLFENADLSESDMRKSDFSFSDFSNANLMHCDLSNANLFCTILSGANLAYADLRGANLNNALIIKLGSYFKRTKIYVTQIKYFWPEITMFYKNFDIYADDVHLASKEEIILKMDTIRGFHLDLNEIY